MCAGDGTAIMSNDREVGPQKSFSSRRFARSGGAFGER